MSFFRGRSRATAASPGYSVIDERLTMRGELETDGTVRVDGRVEGARHRAGTLIVGPRGHVVGDVEACEIVVAGTIEGAVQATGRVEVESGASVTGDIRAAAMVLAEGGLVHGHVAIGAAPAATAGSPRLEISPAAGRGRG